MQHHHVGVTVSDLDRSVAFYRLLFRADPTLRRTYREEYISRLFAYEGAEIEVAFFEIPDANGVLELVEFHHPPAADIGTELRCIGSMHLGLLVPDLDGEVERLRSGGASFRSDDPVAITHGPYAGWSTIFVLDPDQLSLQLMGPPGYAVPTCDEEVAWTG